MAMRLLLVFLALPSTSQAIVLSSSLNPIRKVVTLLQSMQKKVAAEGEKEKELYQKFKCYCKNNGGALKDSIAASAAKIKALTSESGSALQKHKAVKQAIEKAQADRAAAKTALKDAAAMREKEAAAFAAEKASTDADMAALQSAIAALEKGMGGSFLQSSAANSLRQLVQKSSHLYDMDRQMLSSFLEGTENSGYAPASGEIVGILKQMLDTMSASAAEATEAEKAAIENYKALVAAKTKEVNSLTATIERKLKESGDLGVAAVQMENDLADAKEDLAADNGFLVDLEKGCSTKDAEWDAIVKTRAEELAAIAETIKLLNNDDSLELFKKTLPSAGASFVQLQARASSIRDRALAMVRDVQTKTPKPDRAQLDFIVLALHGKRGGFGKVIKMIDEMVNTLKQEQADDDHKKEYCGAQFDSSDDKKKALEGSVADAEGAIAAATDAIGALSDDIAALEAGIKSLDAAVAEATATRKEEHAAFQELMASDAAAKELLGIAKNRLNKFYNPKLYKPAPKTELSASERIAVNMGGTASPTPAPGGIAGTGITAFAQANDAPPPPPETFGAYSKKSEENSGVLAMIDLLVKDLDAEMTESTTEEKDAQADYETMMKHSAEKRALDSKALADKGAAKAGAEEDLGDAKAAKQATTRELVATVEYIQSLHADCDWLLKYADARQEARNGEIDALGNAKAVLSGADYSF